MTVPLHKTLNISTFTETLLCISDFHLGDGNTHERFQHDQNFVQFIHYYLSRNKKLHLVIAGDFFDTVQVQVENKSATEITEDIALEKVKLIVEAHRIVFDTFKEFCTKNQISFIIGNHDPALAFPAVRNYLWRTLNHPTEINFAFELTQGNVQIIHGNQWDSANKFSAEFIQASTSNKLEKMHFPWGSLFLIDYVSEVKKRIPEIEEIKPLGAFLRWSLFHEPKKLFWGVLTFSKFVFRGFQGGEDQYHYSPRKLYKTLKDACHSCDFISQASLALQNKQGILIAGHTHRALRQQLSSGSLYINTGCWNSITELVDSQFVSRQHFTFAEIHINSSGMAEMENCLLQEWLPDKQTTQIYNPTFYNTHLHPPMKGIVWRSVKVALTVWPLLMLINHYEKLFINFDWLFLLSFQSLLTFCVPFSVSLFSRMGEKR